VLLAAIVGVSQGFAADKKSADQKPATAVGNDAQQAELYAILQLANIKVSRMSIAQDPALADAKEALGGIFDRQESATKDGIAKLRSAAGDKAKVADAIKALEAADDEAAKYLKVNAGVNEKLTKRNKILNAELGQIAKTPDDYVAKLKKAGLKAPALDQAKTVVKEASAKAGGKADAEGSSPVAEAQVKVRGMLTPEQGKALDTLFAK
jgi:hypothetical protein